MVSSISKASAFVAPSMFVRGVETFRSRGSGSEMIVLILMMEGR
jgi:hypothetical protein